MPRFSSRLLIWYRDNERDLPWRGLFRGDPYAVWVSEIMLQQTRVETVIPYFEKWMKQFPNVKALADASEQEVLHVWEGLGYYSRARNLHKAAKIVVEKYNGELPRDLGALRQLPGIGRYTVGAIASMAFGLDEPTLDGNLRRVFARVFDVSQPADSSAGEKILWGLAAAHLPRGRAGDYNQALMDLGAAICLPKNPHCLACPLTKLCKARELGIQEKRPVLKPKKSTPHYVYVAAVIIQRGCVLLAKRPSKGLLGGLWEFPNGRVNGDPAKELAKAIQLATRLKVKRKEALGIIRHAYTHFKVAVHVFRCELISISKDENIKWVKLDELQEYPMGRVDRQVSQKL
ncbi:MAG: A/G-specific adenine glycosylase [Chloroflexi bacterium]|nr:A/G-specific adenine glycosylase [Chloroflexota bacterium]MBI3340889.1 A/G-specific adenine glycosylase [Chloroflexota bacterium]